MLAAHFSLVPAREACAAARAALATADRLQGESADALYVEGFVAFIERRWPAMEVAYRRAIDLQPGHVQALSSFGVCLSTRQRFQEALPFFKRAEEADPLAAFPYSLTGGGLLVCGRLEEALASCEDALSFEKDNLIALCVSAIGTGPSGPDRRRHRACGAGRLRLATRPPFRRRPGVGARDRGARGRSADAPRGAAGAPGGVAHGRLRGMAARRARGNGRGLRAARTSGGGVPGLPLLHGGARLRSAARRPAVRGAPGAAGAPPGGSA